MIKQGYFVEVTSWENDADFFNTKRLSGLTKAEAKFLVGILNVIEDARDDDTQKVNWSEVAKTSNQLIVNLGAVSWPTLFEYFEHNHEEGLEALVGDLLGYDEMGRLRTLDSTEVYHTPITLQPVTTL